MKRRVEAHQMFKGPWWVAAALLQIEAEELVLPVLQELHSQVTRSTSIVRTARVECGPVARGARLVTMPVHWRDATHASAFPEMNGELRLVEHDDDSTDLQFVGEYEPPLGTAGAVGDAMAGHRVAQRTIDDAVRRLAQRMEAAVREHIGTAPSASHRPPRSPAQ